MNNKLLELNDPQTLYWLGFIATDGSIDLKTKSVSIELASRDLKQVEKFISFFGSKARPYYRKTRDTYRGRIGFFRNLDTLYSLGIKPNKTKDLVVSDILTRSKEFWLGVMDGDGYFRYYLDKNGWKNHRVTLTTGSEAFADQFNSYIETLGVTPHKYWHPQSNCWKPGICNKKDCDVFLNEIYSSEVESLQRKHSKYLLGRES